MKSNRIKVVKKQLPFPCLQLDGSNDRGQLVQTAPFRSSWWNSGSWCRHRRQLSVLTRSYPPYRNWFQPENDEIRCVSRRNIYRSRWHCWKWMLRRWLSKLTRLMKECMRV